MNVIRNSDQHEYNVYDVKSENNNITFLIYNEDTHEWSYRPATEFEPSESDYFA